jgi:IS5 family transposase
MGPKSVVPASGELFGYLLREHINLQRPLLRLAAGLLYLQHAFGLSDEDVVCGWVDNPYWQVFTGETYLQTEPAIDPSSLTRWRHRLGEEGVEELLLATIEAGRRSGVLRKTSMQTVIVDRTVMPKAIAHPTDSRRLERARQHLVKAAAKSGIKLRQNYNREAPRSAV